MNGRRELIPFLASFSFTSLVLTVPDPRSETEWRKERDGVEKGTGNWDKIGKGKVYLFLTSHPQPSATGW